MQLVWSPKLVWCPSENQWERPAHLLSVSRLQNECFLDRNPLRLPKIDPCDQSRRATKYEKPAFAPGLQIVWIHTNCTNYCSFRSTVDVANMAHSDSGACFFTAELACGREELAICREELVNGRAELARSREELAMSQEELGFYGGAWEGPAKRVKRRRAVRKPCASQKSERRSELRFVSVSVRGLRCAYFEDTCGGKLSWTSRRHEYIFKFEVKRMKRRRAVNTKGQTQINAAFRKCMLILRTHVVENCHVYIPQDDMHAFSNLKQCCPAVRTSCSSQKSERKSALRFVSVSVTGLRCACFEDTGRGKLSCTHSSRRHACIFTFATSRACGRQETASLFLSLSRSLSLSLSRSLSLSLIRSLSRSLSLALTLSLSRSLSRSLSLSFSLSALRLFWGHMWWKIVMNIKTTWIHFQVWSKENKTPPCCDHKRANANQRCVPEMYAYFEDTCRGKLSCIHSSRRHACIFKFEAMLACCENVVLITKEQTQVSVAFRKCFSDGIALCLFWGHRSWKIIMYTFIKTTCMYFHVCDV